MRPILFAAALILLCGGGPADAVDNPACAKFENPLEYNACLARQGPRAGATLAVPEPAGAPPAARGRPAPRGVRPIRSYAGARRSHGRIRMEFTIRRR
jgi:hypothetical protein